MRIFTKIRVFGLLLFAYALISCSGSNKKNNQLIGKYSSVYENEYDNFKDTIEIKRTDDGKYDIQQLSNWSAAKKDDPERPSKNRKAGIWINYGPGKIRVATFQESDNTLRIPEPMSNTVKILEVDFDKKTIQEKTKYGDLIVYHKID